MSVEETKRSIASLTPWVQRSLSAVCEVPGCDWATLETPRAEQAARGHVRASGHTVKVSEERVRAVVPRA
jgi:hypothetical protein